MRSALQHLGTSTLMTKTSTRFGWFDLIGLLLLIIRILWEMIGEKDKEISRLQTENLELKYKLGKVKRVFAPKNEKIQTNDVFTSDSTFQKRKRGAQPNRKPRKRNIPDQLPKKVVEVDVEEIPICSNCGKVYVREKSLDKISNQIRVTIAVIHEMITRKTYKKDCDCLNGKTIVTAPPRNSVIKKSILSTASWVHLIIMKFLLAVPVYRYCQAVRSSGFKLSAGTVENGFKKIGILLEPVYQLLILELRKNRLWSADETRWKVFEHIKGKVSFLWWLWVFASEKVVIYVIDPARSSDVIKRIDAGGKRIISADRYSAYESMKRSGILIAYCWVHLRRDFLNLKTNKEIMKDPAVGKWVDDWLSDIKTLFKLNNKRLKTTSKQEFQQLTADLRLITIELRDQSIESVKYGFQKTILESFKKRFSGYTLFIDHPEIPMHNNRSEQLLKTAINGRKNYLGNVVKASVNHTQIFLSIIATAKNNGVDPQRWLAGYLEACAENNSQPLSGKDLESHLQLLLNNST